MDRRDSAPTPPLTAAKPFKDWLPQVVAYSGELDRAPKAFLAQFYLYAQQNAVPAVAKCRSLLRAARQSIGKLTGAAQTWYTQRPCSGHKVPDRVGLCKAFGQEYTGSRAICALYYVTAQSTPGGAQRPQSSTSVGEGAPASGPLERWPRGMQLQWAAGLVRSSTTNSFLGELTAVPRCCDETPRQLEESADAAAGLTPGRGSLSQTCRLCGTATPVHSPGSASGGCPQPNPTTPPPCSH